jgi:hypothetical protein
MLTFEVRAATSVSMFEELKERLTPLEAKLAGLRGHL